MECFIADGHYLEGLAGCAFLTWRGGVELQVKARKAALTYLANTSVRAFTAWKAGVGAAKISRANSQTVELPLHIMLICICISCISLYIFIQITYL